MDGREYLSRLREDDKFDSICIIIYSTLMDLDRVEALFNTGANRYLKKPSSYPVLKNALDNASTSARKNPLGENFAYQLFRIAGLESAK